MSKSILIVDDSEDVHYILERYLKKANVTTFSSFNGKEALNFLNDKNNQSIKDFPPTTILLDVNMPIMNGFEFLDEYFPLADKFKCSIIMLTSSTLPADKEQASKYDFVKGYVSKPILRDKVEEILRIA